MKLSIVNPATSEIIKELDVDGNTSINKKFKRAKDYFSEYRLIPLSKKIEIIEKFNGLLGTENERLAQLLTSEMGKPIQQSRGEIRAVQNRITFFLENVEEAIKEHIIEKSDSLTEKITYEPWGVVANISAWNYPYFVGANVFIPALLTGNVVLYKPSELTTLTGLAIEQLLYKAGLPEEAFQCIIGGSEAGQALLEQSIDALYFTGSYNTGKKIAKALAGRFIKSQFELGGKDPAYVTDDVPVDEVVAAVLDGAFYNCGQSCCAVERIYVHEKIYDKFIEKAKEVIRAYVQGDPTTDDTYIGPLSRKQQVQVLAEQVKDALDKGAQILISGGKAYANRHPPAALINVDSDMLIMKEESFGPVIGIQKVSSDSEALDLMNDSEYGLTASVFCRDENRATAILGRINSGTVYQNCCDRISPALPWTGRRHSGMGSTLSIVGIQSFVQPKAWHLKRL